MLLYGASKLKYWYVLLLFCHHAQINYLNGSM